MAIGKLTITTDQAQNPLVPRTSEQQIKRVWVGREVTEGQPSRLKVPSVNPFHAGMAHPTRRPWLLSRKNIKQSARGFDQTDAAQPMTIAHGELLLKRGAKTDPKNVGSGGIDGVNDAGFFVLCGAYIHSLDRQC